MVYPTMRFTPASLAASTSACPSAALSAMGFSASTCLPARIPAMVIGCNWSWIVATITASMSALSSISSALA